MVPGLVACHARSACQLPMLSGLTLYTDVNKHNLSESNFLGHISLTSNYWIAVHFATQWCALLPGCSCKWGLV